MRGQQLCNASTICLQLITCKAVVNIIAATPDWEAATEYWLAECNTGMNLWLRATGIVGASVFKKLLDSVNEARVSVQTNETLSEWVIAADSLGTGDNDKLHSCPPLVKR